MGKRGGSRPNAGRKPKSDELKKAEMMDSIASPQEVMMLLYKKVEEGDISAIKFWIEMRFGRSYVRKDEKASYIIQNRLFDKW